ncbi:MAG: methylated-DNA--[protein]-cysteine S-methyltransferase [Desulfovibrionaceae bacterium]|nr:methylated-DNA--[protein]-cysteine S-methyltransferase [Desulfovibrionaceae bacterium]
MTLAEEDGRLIMAQFGARREPAWHMEPSPLLRLACGQLREYFAGRLRDFDLPLAPRGTEFQRLVWRALRAIPYGETRSYGQTARAIGRPRACRAVGLANNRNPIAIIVPCHRVIGADGSLTGYAAGLPVKAALLALEKTGVFPG